MNKIKFCDASLINKKKQKKIKIFSRSSVILSHHVGQNFYVHVGNRFFVLLVKEEMKGFRFGEFCLTRKQFSHKKKK